jgi:hypothetical protein
MSEIGFTQGFRMMQEKWQDRQAMIGVLSEAVKT